MTQMSISGRQQVFNRLSPEGGDSIDVKVGLQSSHQRRTAGSYISKGRVDAQGVERPSQMEATNKLIGREGLPFSHPGSSPCGLGNVPASLTLKKTQQL